MIGLIYPSVEEYSPCDANTLEIGEVEGYDFTSCARQIYRILSVLKLANLIGRMPYSSVAEVKEVVIELIDDIDLGNEELQISEKRYIRVEFRDELLAIEVFVGV